jgi:DNA-binding MarR family transcriptional regulator
VSTAAPSEYGPYIGSMLRHAHQWVMTYVHAHVSAAGYRDLSPAQLAVLAYPGPEGQRPSQLADRLRITKQSLNDLLRELEVLGYLVRARDPADGRARIVHLTARGREVHTVAAEGARAAEAEIAELLGAPTFAQLRSALATIGEHLAAHGNGPVVGKPAAAARTARR